MNQQQLLDTAARYIPGGCLGMLSLPADLRMVMVRGEGSKVYDASGREYLDYLLGSGPLLLGHARPEIVEAVQKQVAAGSTYFALTEPAIRLAEKVVEAVPCGEALRYQTTGSDATFSALRLARAYTGRDKVLKFEGGWHGIHDVGMLSAAPAEATPLPEPVPDCDGIPSLAKNDVLVAPFNDVEAATRLIDAHHDQLAAVILEPLQRSLRPVPGFLEALRAATEKHGIVLIFDEIVTGFRVAWGGAQERYGVVPDLACYGKAMAGGFPLSAVVGKADLVQLADPNRKGKATYCFMSGTLTGNPIAAAAGMAALEVLEQPGVYDRLHLIGRRLAEGIESAALDLDIPVQVLGDGPVLQAVFSSHQPMRDHRDLLRGDKKKAVKFGHELIRRGVYCTPGGKLYLSLAHSDADLERTIEIARDALAAVRQSP
jgi:glutamate-1-semialdehyde 2,1-aminomutase